MTCWDDLLHPDHHIGDIGVDAMKSFEINKSVELRVPGFTT